jgi:hypothetical protein
MASTVISIVGTFKSAQMLVGAVGTGVVGVNPPFFDASITGQEITGDGSVAYGVPGQQLGAVTVIAGPVAAPGGVPSAQAFGAVGAAITTTVHVGAVPSAQAFGAVVPAFKQTLRLAGLGSAQGFGVVTIHAAITEPSGGVPSAQAFGAVHLLYPQWIGLGGVVSAQAFGAAATGLLVLNVWLHDLTCIETPIPSITDLVICGDGHVCGGVSFIVPASPPITSFSPAILNEFLCGDGTVVDGESMITPIVCV